MQNCNANKCSISHLDHCNRLSKSPATTPAHSLSVHYMEIYFHDPCLHLCFLWVLKSFEKGSNSTKLQIQRTCTEKQTVGITGRTGVPIRRVLKENKRKMAVEGSRVAVMGEMKMTKSAKPGSVYLHSLWTIWITCPYIIIGDHNNVQRASDFQWF